MTNQFNNTIGGNTSTDVGLRNFMLGTYRYMGMAMGVTGVVAYFFGQYLIANPAAQKLVFSPITGLIAIGVIMFGFGAVGKKLPSMSLGGVLAFLFGFAAFMGVMISPIGLFYDPAIIAKVFFMTVGLFGALSFFGHTTERNLSAYIKYALIAFAVYVGINMLGWFVPSLRPTGTMDLIITGIALLAISFIAAWETQMLKRTYYSVAGHPAMQGKMAAFGAASLLLTFINMFQILLSLFGRD